MPSGASRAAISRACSHAASTPGLAIALGQPADPPGRQPRRPVRRAQARHAAAFLIDQDRRIGAAHGRAQVVDEGAHLVRVGAIAREQDEAPGSVLAQQRPLGLGQHEPGHADDCRLIDRPDAAAPGSGAPGSAADDEAAGIMLLELFAQALRRLLSGERADLDPVEHAVDRFRALENRLDRRSAPAPDRARTAPRHAGRPPGRGLPRAGCGSRHCSRSAAPWSC